MAHIAICLAGGTLLMVVAFTGGGMLTPPGDAALGGFLIGIGFTEWALGR